MFRTTLTTPRTRRCSGAVVAAATAALVLAPGAAFAAGQPAGPGSGHPVSHQGGGHSGHTGHTTGHAGAGHSTSHRTGHAGAGHGTTHTTGHTTRHTTGHGHSTSAGKAAAHHTKTAAHGTRTGAADGDSVSSGSASGDYNSPQNPGSKRSSSSQTVTVTKLSVSKSADDGTVIMTARVSPAHRSVGAAGATGTVDFSLDGTSSGPIPLSGGRAMVQAEMGPGEHTATAKYSGDAKHAPSDSEPVTVTAG